jgi:DASS family divalent anion:Na+ symporter
MVEKRLAGTPAATARSAWWRWAVVLVPGALIYCFSVPGLDAHQGRILGIFAATIVALVAQPVPMGVSVLLAMTALALTRTLPPAQVLSGFANVTVWLIFTAFLFARAVTSTGFGARVGYLFIRHFGKTPLGLGYSMAGANLTLAPFIPSDTARGGGVIFPIARSVAAGFGSKPGDGGRTIGAYMMLVSFHVTYPASGLYLTGMAANPLIAEFAARIGHVELTWLRWFSGSIVPGLVTMVLVPWLLARWVKPDVRDTAAARELARAELRRRGALSREERWLVAIMIAVMAGWVTSPWHGIPNTFVALAGVGALLLARVLSWDDLLAERNAWDALIWFAPLMMMTEALAQAGVVKIFAAKIFALMGGLPWMAVLVALVAVYLYVHYLFASLTAQVTVLYAGFLAAAVAAGVPPLVAALALAYFSSLNAAMTHYGTGSAPVFFGAGYVRQVEWWRIGFRISVVHLVVWMGVGLAWWKLLGWW